MLRLQMGRPPPLRLPIPRRLFLLHLRPPLLLLPIFLPPLLHPTATCPSPSTSTKYSAPSRISSATGLGELTRPGLPSRLCSLLLGDLDQCRTWLGLDNDNSPYRNPSVVEFVLENAKDDDDNDLPRLCKLLETWLMEVVFPRFRETRDIEFSLGDYYDDPTVLRYLERLDGTNGSPLAAAAAIVRIGAEATAFLDNVKASAIQALRKVFPLGERDKNMTSQEDREMNYSLLPEDSGDPLDEFYEADSIHIPEVSGRDGSVATLKEESITEQIKDASVKIMCAGVVIGLMTLVGLKYLPGRNSSSSLRKELGSVTLVTASDVVSSEVPVVVKSAKELPKMDAQIAEGLVRKWQNIKSQAFGPAHSVEKLSEVRIP